MNSSYRLLTSRLGVIPPCGQHPHQTVQGINDLAHQLYYQGGLTQQQRMIRDKKKTLDKAVLYSYQGAVVKKILAEGAPQMINEDINLFGRALINPNKLKADYDEKVISIGFEHGFDVGTVFEWMGTDTYWLIYLQEITELAYFRGDIRRCEYALAWENEDGTVEKTFAAIRGPVETRIESIQKHKISMDTPNHSLDIMIPKTPNTLKYFQRYSKFYLQNLMENEQNLCWRVEATDSISTPGILEITAVEYYANKDEDDIENGIAGAIKAEVINPNGKNIDIIGETFIKPKKTYEYSLSKSGYTGEWTLDKQVPVKLEPFVNEKGRPAVRLKWETTYTGQFELKFNKFSKTIVVESLF